MWTLLVSMLHAAVAIAIPTGVYRRTGPTPLSSSAVAAFKPYTLFASAAYCPATETQNWTCGANCDALPGFIPTAAGGDGDATQFWFVGFFPPLNSVVVAHQGTDPKEILALATDSDSFLGSLNTTLFPGVSSSVQVHSGFRDEHASTAPLVLSAVLDTLAAYNTTQVILSGHSLGAALTLLDSVFLFMNLPNTVGIKVVNYGMPRVGNQDFANLVDSLIPDLTHINNKEDPVPILPGRFLGFVHPSGEVHIQDSGQFVACAGQDDTESGCEIASVPNILESDLSDHDGPYDGVEMGC